MKHGTQLDSNMLITKIIILVAVGCGASYKPENFQKIDEGSVGRHHGFYFVDSIPTIKTPFIFIYSFIQKLHCQAGSFPSLVLSNNKMNLSVNLQRFSGSYSNQRLTALKICSSFLSQTPFQLKMSATSSIPASLKAEVCRKFEKLT